MKLNELPNGSKLNVEIKIGDKSGTFHAMTVNPTKAGVLVVFTEFPTGKKITFGKGNMEVYYYRKNRNPLTWRGVSITYEGGYYHIVSKSDAANFNRRGAHRIAVRTNGTAMFNGGSLPGFIKDISITGFAVIDFEKKYNLGVGDTIGFAFSDLGFTFSLRGKVRRIKEENGVLYGCQLTNQNNELREYLARRERTNKAK
ncbi:MAG: PilZ domain-containing protein [Lachnospiraceae bacterium]|nr:PilZ domain-containing protein [Lachnospiraceae bacterium]